jgi:hypothetical protein
MCQQLESPYRKHSHADIAVMFLRQQKISQIFTTKTRETQHSSYKTDKFALPVSQMYFAFEAALCHLLHILQSANY